MSKILTWKPPPNIQRSLSLIGKEVTVTDPDDKEKRITGKVTEASFEDGTGKIKVGDKYYSISYILNVKDNSLTGTNDQT